MIKDLDDEERENNITEIVDKLDDVCVGYENQDIMSALMTLMTWLIVDIHKNTGMELDYMINQVHNGLSETIPIQLAAEKEISN